MLVYIKKMITEKEDLEGKIKKAVELIQKLRTLKLDKVQIELLESQISFMREYNKILANRISYEKKIHGE